MTDKKVSVTRATSTSFLIDFARAWSLDKDFGLKLASALIYANLAEFFAISLIDSIYYESHLRFLPREETTTLESSIRKLRKVNFQSKEKIMKLLKIIKGDRNDLFHGLIRVVHKEEIDFSNMIKRISNNVEQLMAECVKIQPTFKQYDKFLKLAHEVAKAQKKS